MCNSLRNTNRDIFNSVIRACDSYLLCSFSLHWMGPIPVDRNCIEIDNERLRLLRRVQFSQRGIWLPSSSRALLAASLFLSLLWRIQKWKQYVPLECCVFSNCCYNLEDRAVRSFCSQNLKSNMRLPSRSAWCHSLVYRFMWMLVHTYKTAWRVTWGERSLNNVQCHENLNSRMNNI
jgi:hypothetical protein